ncbi:hypothetical protein J2T10_001988 [Paenarthrobacter nicotinovorans]|uniref:Uncharacterized protein n=1 Tax=Paenarthrobacter nicotinovorans TaxID=29320 RepID=A0ABT9TPC2_PAENI|nr:hypothetical protein [Paenarthrobacter nicotinovorans]MDQ0102342.1 hypothetical protein [Paenarthrobacter nicotinovorans]
MTRLEELANAYQAAKDNEQAADKAEKDAHEAYTLASDKREEARTRTYEAHKAMLSYLEPQDPGVGP